MNKRLKIAVTGASGMLGTALIDFFSRNHDVFATSRSKGLIADNIQWDLFDLTDQVALINWLEYYQPEVVIHAAALINMDFCEKNYEAAYALHVESTATISNTLINWGGRLIYISSDAVFDGRKLGGYCETDLPNPLSVYGVTKLAGEKITLARSNGTVLRTNIFGWTCAGHVASFSEWVLKGLCDKARLTMFTDVVFTPIYVSHVAELIGKMLGIGIEIAGLFHLAGNSSLSKYEFSLIMAKTFALSNDCIVPVSIDDVGLLAERPKNMALCNQKITALLKVALPTVEEGLAYLKQQRACI